jgi:hypothetical protein
LTLGTQISRAQQFGVLGEHGPRVTEVLERIAIDDAVGGDHAERVGIAFHVDHGDIVDPAARDGGDVGIAFDAEIARRGIAALVFLAERAGPAADIEHEPRVERDALEEGLIGGIAIGLHRVAFVPSLGCGVSRVGGSANRRVRCGQARWPQTVGRPTPK